MAKRTRKTKRSSNLDNKVANIKSARKSRSRTNAHKRNSIRSTSQAIMKDTDQIAKQMADFIKEMIGIQKKQSKTKKATAKKPTKMTTSRRKNKSVLKLSTPSKKRSSSQTTTQSSRRKKPSRTKSLIAMKTLTAKPQKNKKTRKTGTGRTAKKRTGTRLSLVKK